jgi:hypothetical protein
MSTETKQEQLHLKTPIELGRMDKDELIEYIDQLHSAVRNYQIVINVAVSKNLNVGNL